MPHQAVSRSRRRSAFALLLAGVAATGVQRISSAATAGEAIGLRGDSASQPDERAVDGPASSTNLRTLGFEDGPVGSKGDPFFVPTEGWGASLVEHSPAEGARCARLSLLPGAKSTFGNLMGFVDAAPYRGKRVRLTSQMRLPKQDGHGQMWLRVDRPGARTGGFDNMGDRPVRGRAWTPATIELDVEDDAVNLALGWLALEGATMLDVDAVDLRIVGDAAPRRPSVPPRALTERGLANLGAATRLLALIRFFHPADQAVGVRRWDLAAIDLMERAEPAGDPAALAEALSAWATPLAPTVQIWAGGVDDGPPPVEYPPESNQLRSWEHHGVDLAMHDAGRASNVYRSKIALGPVVSPVDEDGRRRSWYTGDLGGGVACRVPLMVPADARGTLPHGAPPSVLAEVASPRLTLLDRSTRLADVATAWGVLQHFYPYFDVIEVDWDAMLDAALGGAAVAATESRAVKVVSLLVAALRDGHGGVHSTEVPMAGMLPLALRWCGDDLVVVGSQPPAPEEIRPGDVVLSIDARSAAELLESAAWEISAATEGWLKHRAAGQILWDGRLADPAEVVLRRPDGTVIQVHVPKGPVPSRGQKVASEHRPPNGSELAPGVVYFDLNGTSNDALSLALPALEVAQGIVFDLRGYPADAAFSVIQHLIDEPVRSPIWCIPVVTQPDRRAWRWSTEGRWTVEPKAPRLRARVAFLTDGRAISYAESILGIVEAYRLGEIVGETTAGTNGNVNPLVLPSGTTVTWTGMRVLKHDETPHHGVGIVPTIVVVPTPAGIAAGRDEVMERAVEFLRRDAQEPEPKRNPPVQQDPGRQPG